MKDTRGVEREDLKMIYFVLIYVQVFFLLSLREKEYAFVMVALALLDSRQIPLGLFQISEKYPRCHQRERVE